MAYAVLGEIGFDLLRFNGLSTQRAADWAEHARIDGKPRLQWIGERLIEHRIDLALHARFCVPDTELARLRQALSDHQALAFVLGNGTHLGYFVISDLSETSQHADATGTLVAAEASLTLREYVGDPSDEAAAAPAVQPDQLPASARNSTAPQAKAALPVPGAEIREAIRKTVTLASQARAGVATISDGLRIARGLTSNPVAALSRIPDLAANASQLATGLSGFAPALAPVADSLKEAGPILSASTRALSAANAMRTVLSSGTTPGNVADHLSEAATRLDSVSGELTGVAPALARLAAQVATRSS
jgi:phage protein U